MIRYRRSFLPPMRVKKITSADRLRSRITYTLRLGPKPDLLALPIYSQHDVNSDVPSGLSTPELDWS